MDAALLYRRLASWVCIEGWRVSASYLGVHAEVLGIGTERFFGDRPRPCKPSGASRGDWKRLLQRDDARMKSVCPVGTGVPDDAPCLAARSAEKVAALYQQGRSITSAPSRNSKTRCQILHRISTGPRPGIRRTALMPWSGRSANLLVEPMNGEGIYELYRRDAEAAAQRKP
jgi:hypothetical protein